MPTASLKPFPGNPRRGDVGAIAQSIKALGQYRPVTVNQRTGEILRGNHTWMAVRHLNLPTTAVTFVDVDRQTARKIVLADNRTHDLGTDDPLALVALLTALPDLEGTGFSEADLALLETGASLDDAPGGGGGGGGGLEPVIVKVGPYRLEVDPDAYQPWAAAMEARCSADKPTILRHLRRALGFSADGPRTPRSAERRRGTVTTPGPAAHRTLAAEQVDPSTLEPYPGNARQGDVGAICVSLDTLGQYTPLVVQRETRRILVGNHTWMAVQALGWPLVEVVWVDCDEDTARKIVVADNRTADLGDYRPDDLVTLLTSIEDLTGTGWDGDDLDDLLAADRPRPSAPDPVTVRVGSWGTRIDPGEWSRWDAGMREAHGTESGVCDAIGDALSLPGGSWISS